MRSSVDTFFPFLFFIAFTIGVALGHDGSHPKYEVTGLVYGPKIINAAILNGKIVWEGKTYELPSIVEITVGGRVRADSDKLIKIEKIGKKGVTISHVGSATTTVPLKRR